MNTTTFLNRVSKSNNADLVKKDGSLNAKTAFIATYDLANLALGDKYHPIYWSKSSSHFGLNGTSDKNRMLALLNAAGIEFEEGNDAPKGGLNGYYIRLTKKGLKQVKDIDFRSLRK